MKLALSLVSKTPTDEFLDTHNVKFEDYILYQYGYFLDLIHQLKDKIGHLCDSLTTNGAYVEKTKFKISRLIKKDEIKKMAGLCDELKKWGQEAENQIAWSLGKRTRHHHFRTKLTLNPNLTDLSLYRTFQINPPIKGVLTDYGKRVISERGIAGLNGWQQEVKEDIEQTIEFTEKSLEAISKILLENCNLPKMEESAEIISNHFKMLDPLKIENLSSREKISSEFEPIVELIEKVMPQILMGNLASLYIIGSIPRGEAIPGYSDLNIVVVVETGDDSNLIVQGMKGSIEKFKNNLEILETTFDMIVLTREDFLSEGNKKLRFICKNDGLLLGGEDLIQKEEFPKPGLQLAFLLI